MDNPEILSETRLLEAIRLKRPADWAIRRLYQDGYRMCSSYVLNNGGNSQDAEDVFQDVIVAFIEMVQDGRFRGESSITSLLFSMMRHQWLNELRRRGRAQKRETAYAGAPANTESNPAAGLLRAGLRDEVTRLVGSLGEVCRDILLAFYFEGLPIREILSRTGYQNEQVLRNKKAKCMKTLVEKLANNGELLDYFKSMLEHEP